MQVLPSLVTGGVERGTVDITRALTTAGWTAIVVSSGGPMVREVERAGGVHIELPVASKNPLVMRANIGRLADAIAFWNIDIIHARSRAPAWSALAAARRTGRHFVTTMHGSYGAASVLKRRYNAIMVKGERVIAISDFIARIAIERYGADPARVRIIPRGVDFEIFDPASVSAERVIQLSTAWRLPDDCSVIMLPARLTRWKGQQVLIEAVSRLGRTDLRCVLVGHDQGRESYVRELRDDIARLGVESIVHLVGHCNDMPAAYKLSDVVVSASTQPEAFGRVAAEAQAMGRPVIASNHGASPETVKPGETGWLVTPGDAQALATALEEALALDAGQRDELARRAMAHVRESFSRQRMCDQTLEVYAEVLEAGKAVAA